MPRKIATLSVPMPEEDIEHFTLGDMFPQGQVFTLHLSLKVLTHMRLESGSPYPKLLGQVRFTERELDLMQPLYHQYPSFVPYEVLLASFNRGFAGLSERAVMRARQRLEVARLEEGMWDAELRPVRNVMSRTRFKLREVGLEVVSMLEVGYVLMKNPRW